MAAALFVNAVKGVSALQQGRDLDVQHKTAFVLARKLREAWARVRLRAKSLAWSRSTAPTSASIVST